MTVDLEIQLRLTRCEPLTPKDRKSLDHIFYGFRLQTEQLLKRVTMGQMTIQETEDAAPQS